MGTLNLSHEVRNMKVRKIGVSLFPVHLEIVDSCSEMRGVSGRSPNLQFIVEEWVRLLRECKLLRDKVKRLEHEKN
jgi:hypothetical protein